MRHDRGDQGGQEGYLGRSRPSSRCSSSSTSAPRAGRGEAARDRAEHPVPEPAGPRRRRVVLVLTAFFAFAIAAHGDPLGGREQGLRRADRLGRPGSRLAPAGKNEFSALATALNTMAESLHEADVARQASIDALQESEEKYRSFVETSTDWIWAIDREGRHTFSNDRVRDILGIEPEELLRRPRSSCSTPRMSPGPGRRSKPACRPAEGGGGSCCGGATGTGPTGGSSPTRWPSTDAAGHPRRFQGHRPRHHRAPEARGRAGQGPEARGDRDPGRRHRARLQQPAAGAVRVHLPGEDEPRPARQGGRDARAGREGARRCP